MEIIKLAVAKERFASAASTSCCRPTASPTAATSCATSRSSQAHPSDRHLPAGDVTGDDRVRAPEGATRPSTGCSTPRASSRSGSATPASGPKPAHQSSRTGEDRVPRAERPRRRHPRGGAPTGRPGHDEFTKFLAPYGRFSSYRTPTAPGAVRLPAHPRGLDESADHGHRVGRRRRRHRGLLPRILGLEHLCFFFDLPGLTQEEMTSSSTSWPRRCSRGWASPWTRGPSTLLLRRAHTGRRHYRRRPPRRRPDSAVAASSRPSPAKRCSTWPATSCCRPPSSRTPTSTRRSSPTWCRIRRATSSGPSRRSMPYALTVDDVAERAERAARQPRQRRHGDAYPRRRGRRQRHSRSWKRC